MQLKTYKIIATLNLDCFHHIGLYSDRAHIVWITFLALTDKPTLLLRCTNSLEKQYPGLQLSNSMPTIRLARLAAGLVHRLWFQILMTLHCEIFGRWNIGGLLSKPPIRQDKFPAKISGHTVYQNSWALFHPAYFIEVAGLVSVSHGGRSVSTSHCLALSWDSTTIDSFLHVLGGKPVLCRSCTASPTSRSSLVHCYAATYVCTYVVVLHTIASCPPCIPIAQYQHKWMAHDTTWQLACSE